MRKNRKLDVALAAAACLALSSVAACGVADDSAEGAVNLTFASGLPAATSLGGAPTELLTELQEESDGAVSFEMFQDGSLLSLPDTLAGVRDGRADLGLVNGTGHPQELPLTSVVGVPFVTADVYAQTRALQALYDESEIYQDEWDKLGLKVLYFAPVPSGTAGTREPLESADDFDGMRMRTAGLLADAIAPMGADPVDLPVAELYESLQRDLVDGWVGQIFDLGANLGLYELRKNVTNLGTGVYSTTVVAINKEKWESLSDEQQAIFEDAKDHYYDDIVVSVTTKFEDAACDTAIEQEAKLAILPAPAVEAWKNEVLPGIEAKWKSAVSDAGISDADADAFLGRYRELAAEYEADSDYVDGLTACIERQGQ